MSLTVIIPPTDVSPTTGTGNAVLATSPTLTTPISATLTSPASTNLTLGLGTGGTALTLASSTLAATFAGAVTAVGDLFGSYSASGAVKLTNSNGIGGIFGYSDAGTTTQWYIASDATNLLIGTGTALPVAIRTNGVNALTISTTQAATFASSVSVSSTTAGASNAGALVVQGGISAGNTGSAASYFGGSISFPSDKGIVSSVNDGRLFLDGSANQNGGSIILYGSAHGSFPAQTIYAANTHVYKNISGTQQLSLSLTDATFAGAVTTGGNLLVGSSTTLGTASPTAISVVGRLRSYQGSASVADTAYVDVPLTMPRGLVAYFAMSSSGNSSHQSAGFFRANDNGASSNYTLFSQSENSIAVTMSPTAGNIRITNNTGFTETITYTFTMIAGQ